MYIQIQTEEDTYLSISKTVQNSNQESLKSNILQMMVNVDLEQNYSCQVCNSLNSCYLKGAEGEVDEVSGVAAVAVHTFIYQHSEDHFMNSQQRNQYQCCSGQAEGHNVNIQWCIMIDCTVV